MDAPAVHNVTASVLLQDAPSHIGSAYAAPCVWVDNNANVFMGFLHAYVDAAATFYVIQKYTGGLLVDEWHIWPPDGFKADSGAFTPSGDTVIGLLTDHGAADPTTGRRPIRVLDFAIPGIFAAYPHGTIPAGAPGAVLPGGGGPQVTADEVVAALATALATAHTPLGDALDTHIKNNSKIGAQNAITGLQVLRVGSTADEKYATLRHDDRDGAYEAIVSYFGPKAEPKP